MSLRFLHGNCLGDVALARIKAHLPLLQDLAGFNTPQAQDFK